MTLRLTPSEVAHLSQDARCKVCGHLEVLHNYHCCTFCTLDECACDNGKWDAKEMNKYVGEPYPLEPPIEVVSTYGEVVP